VFAMYTLCLVSHCIVTAEGVEVSDVSKGIVSEGLNVGSHGALKCFIYM
jgi:hypothetical protein